MDAHFYVPALKWRQGEYQSLFKLEDDVKDKVIPLLIIPPREYDFEEQKMKKTVHEHIETFPKRLKEKWGARVAFLDIHSSLENESMDDGRLVVDYLLQEAKKKKCNVRPVVGVGKGATYLGAIKKHLVTPNDGLVLCVKLEELMRPTADTDINNLVNSIGASWPEIDLVFDLGNPGNFEPYKVFASAIASAISKLTGCTAAKSKTILATSLKLSEVKKPGKSILRHEWSLYHELRTSLNKAGINPWFGDYTIETPDFAPGMDMRKTKPAGKIVYTTPDSWFIPKGGAFRDNTDQMISHCLAIIKSGHYKGAIFSQADKRIEDTANKTDNCGNLTTWKFVGVNHHITFVVRQLATRYGI